MCVYIFALQCSHFSVVIFRENTLRHAARKGEIVRTVFISFFVFFPPVGLSIVSLSSLPLSSLSLSAMCDLFLVAWLQAAAQRVTQHHLPQKKKKEEEEEGKGCRAAVAAAAAVYR